MSDFNPDCVLIPLSKTGKLAWQYTTIVSPEDADLEGDNWLYMQSGGYVSEHLTRNREPRPQWMHQIILERKIGRHLESGEFTDHIDGCRLNNTRENLRVATRSQNNQNAKIRKDNRYGCKGICLVRDGVWQGVVHKNKVAYRTATFRDLDEACKATNELRAKLHGEFARFE